MTNPKRKLPNSDVFDDALRKVLRLSKDDLNQMLADEKKANEGKPKRGPKPHSKRTPRKPII
jgi:hypothetical protein